MTPAPPTRSPYVDINAALVLSAFLTFVGTALANFIIPTTFCLGLAIAVIGAASGSRRGALSIVAAFPIAFVPFWAIPLADSLARLGLRDSDPTAFAITTILVAIALGFAWWRWWVGVVALTSALIGYFVLEYADPPFDEIRLAVAIACAGTLAPCYLAARQAVREKHIRDVGLCPHCRYDCRNLPATASGQVLCPECGRPLPTPAPTPASPT